jgi:hypothetical protein
MKKFHLKVVTLLEFPAWKFGIEKEAVEYAIIPLAPLGITRR